MIDNVEVTNADLEEFHKYFKEADILYDTKLLAENDRMRSCNGWLGNSRDECIAIYMMLRKTKPRVVMEACCNNGCLSRWILHALRENEKEGFPSKLYAFEIMPEYIKTAADYCKEFNNAEFIEGDVTPGLSCAFGLVGGHENYINMSESKKNTLKNALGKVGFVDFLIVDGYHNYQFGKWWTYSTPPYITKNGILCVHDVIFKDGEIQDNPSAGDESKAIREMIQDEPSKYKAYMPPVPYGYRESGFLFLRVNKIGKEDKIGKEVMNKEQFHQLFVQEPAPIQNEEELWWLYNKIKEINPLKTVIEIGLSGGGSFRFWRELLLGTGNELKELLLIGVDKEYHPDLVYKSFNETAIGIDMSADNKDYHFDSKGIRIEVITGLSEDPNTIKRVKKILGDRKVDVDFLMIDGHHEYFNVSSDYNNYSPFVRKGGIIGFHDAGTEHVNRVFMDIPYKNKDRIALAHGTAFVVKD